MRDMLVMTGPGDWAAGREVSFFDLHIFMSDQSMFTRREYDRGTVITQTVGILTCGGLLSGISHFRYYISEI